mgnify:CR=1 FL=1
MPARLDTGVSYVGGRAGDDFLRDAVAEIDGAEGESVFAEGEKKSVGEVDGESKEMSVVVEGRFGVTRVVVAGERRVVDEKHVGGEKTPQDANDGLEETDVDVVVEGGDGAGHKATRRPTASVSPRR